MGFKACLLLAVFMLGLGCRSQNVRPFYRTENLEVIQLSPKVFVHISYIDIPDYGKFACNGLIYVDKREAIVFDTPADDPTSVRLISWIENKLGAEVKAVVATHFHEDCLGGLAVFHSRNIPSYANALTIELAKRDNAEIPENGFQQSLELKVGNEKVANRFFGEGHTADNIVSYLPGEKILFGGCLIKEVGAGKGNLEDANINEWANTVKEIKKAYPGLKFVVPGHGKPGGAELLDYTIGMFEKQ